MVTVSAFKDGFTALRANPILLVAGLLVGVGSQLQYVDHLIESPLLSAGASLAWLVVFPFVLGGFIGTARAAIDGTDASLTQFFTVARTHYLRLLLATVVFVLLVFGTAVGLGLIGFVLGIGSMALGAIHEMAAFVAGVISLLIWLVSILVVVMFVQFYDTAIVIENESVTDAFRRSIELVQSNLKSVTGFSLAWLVLLNVFFIPEYLLELTMTEAGPADVLPVELGIPIVVLLPIGIVLSAVGFAYFYTVYTAYYIRLIAASASTPESV
jgi:MFS family permease